MGLAQNLVLGLHWEGLARGVGQPFWGVFYGGRLVTSSARGELMRA